MRPLQLTALLIFLAVIADAQLLRAQTGSPAKPASTPQPTSTATPATTAKPKPSPEQPKPLRPRYEELGRSVQGRAIEAMIYGTGKKRVLVVGGIHGNESATTVVARALAVTIGRDSIHADLTVVIVPDANPDALMSNLRVNSRGVDINRNFPSKTWRADYPDSQRYPGTEPASEPETRALISLLEKHPPDLLITLHAALGCMNWDGPGGSVAALMAQVNKYPLCGYLGYETPGSFGTYAGIDRNIPVVTIELRAVNPLELVKENLPALFAALENLATKNPVGPPPAAPPKSAGLIKQ